MKLCDQFTVTQLGDEYVAVPLNSTRSFQGVVKLNESGAVYIVIRKQQGAESALKYLKTVFAQVETVEKSGGFWVIRCDGGKKIG